SEGRLRTFQRSDAILEHGNGRIAVTGIDERVFALALFPLEPRLGGLGAGIEEALRQKQRLGGFGIGAPAGTGMDHSGARAQFFVHSVSGRPGLLQGPEMRGARMSRTWRMCMRQMRHSLFSGFFTV